MRRGSQRLNSIDQPIIRSIGLLIVIHAIALFVLNYQRGGKKGSHCEMDYIH